MNKYVSVLLLLLTLISCTPKWNLPIDNAHVEGWYSQNNHQVLHIFIDELPTSQELIDTVNWAIDLADGYLIPDHGFYLVFETTIDNHRKCAFVMGLTYEATRINLAPQLLHPSLIHHQFNYHWPSHISDRDIALGYAWLCGLYYNKIHPWFPELAGGYVKPLDSDFIGDRNGTID